MYIIDKKKWFISFKKYEREIKMVQIIKNTFNLDVRNLDALPRGLNCKYLKVIEAHVKGIYIAHSWKRTLTKKDTGIFIQLKK